MKHFIGLVLLLVAIFGHAQQVPHITIITSDQFVFDGNEMSKYQVAEFYNVDEFTRADKKINQGLVADEAKSAEIVQQRLPQLQEMISRGFRAGMLVKRWELNHLPAIVFEKGAAVYYGMDIGKAVDAWFELVEKGNDS